MTWTKFYKKEKESSPKKIGRLRNKIFESELEITCWIGEPRINGTDCFEPFIKPLETNEYFEDIAKVLGTIVYRAENYFQNGFTKLPFNEQMREIREMHNQIRETIDIMNYNWESRSHALCVLREHMHLIDKMSKPYLNSSN